MTENEIGALILLGLWPAARGEGGTPGRINDGYIPQRRRDAEKTEQTDKLSAPQRLCGETTHD